MMSVPEITVKGGDWRLLQVFKGRVLAMSFEKENGNIVLKVTLDTTHSASQPDDTLIPIYHGGDEKP